MISVKVSLRGAALAALTLTRAGSMPMLRHLLYLQLMHFLLSAVIAQSPATLLRHLWLSARCARRRKNARQE